MQKVHTQNYQHKQYFSFPTQNKTQRSRVPSLMMFFVIIQKEKYRIFSIKSNILKNTARENVN